MSDVLFTVEADPTTPWSAEYVAAAEAILRDHLEQHPPLTAPAEATSEGITLDEELTPENVLAHLVWQRSHPEDVQFRSLSDPLVLTITVSSLTYFFAGFISEAGKDAWLACRRLCTKLLHPRGDTSPTPVIVRDADTGTELHLQSLLKQELSDQAWRELVTIALPKRPKNCTGSKLIWSDRSSFVANANVSFHTDEASGQIFGEALFAVEDDADESEHDQWVLDIELTAEANSREDAPTGRRWLRRPRKAEDEPKSLTLRFKWKAQKRRWVLPR